MISLWYRSLRVGCNWLSAGKTGWGVWRQKHPWSLAMQMRWGWVLWQESVALLKRRSVGSRNFAAWFIGHGKHCSWDACVRSFVPSRPAFSCAELGGMKLASFYDSNVVQESGRRQYPPASGRWWSSGSRSCGASPTTPMRSHACCTSCALRSDWLRWLLHSFGTHLDVIRGRGPSFSLYTSWWHKRRISGSCCSKRTMLRTIRRSRPKYYNDNIAHEHYNYKILIGTRSFFQKQN